MQNMHADLRSEDMLVKYLKAHSTNSHIRKKTEKTTYKQVQWGKQWRNYKL